VNISHKIWPLGKLPKNMQRPELDMLKNNGYKWDDPFDVVSLFEEKISNYANCKYAIAVDNCTDAIFLCLEYLKYSGKIDINEVIIFPSNCYVSIPMVAKKCGFNIGFVEKEWSGVYQLGDTAVWDSAGRFTQGMYIKQSYQCLSFQIKKRIPIGKGGMILTDNPNAMKWLKLARYEGRDLNVDYSNQQYKILGWNMYMTPEDAARGILIMDKLPLENEDTHRNLQYPNLSNQKIFL